MTPTDSSPCTNCQDLVALGEIMWGVLDAAPIGTGLAVKGPESLRSPAAGTEGERELTDSCRWAVVLVRS